MKNNIIFSLFCMIMIYIFYIIYYFSKENFYIHKKTITPLKIEHYFSKNNERIPIQPSIPIQTFTPYYIDPYYQPPQFNNYFYYDGYMYPRRGI